MRKLSEKESVKKRTNATIEASKSPRVRWVTGKSIKVEIDKKKHQQIVDSIVHDEVDRHMMIGAIKEKGPLTVEELAQITSLQPETVLRHVIALRRKGILTEAGEKDRQYCYQLI